ncbi:hypothetical protein ACWFMI_24925 [Nocardiopsis terrae]|uniref:hypothetical protein n=1 Tax=Streptomyces sp. NPDC057554 TaxID=3350538 RepID=UPI0036AD0EF5
MIPEQFISDARALIALTDEHTQVLTRAAEVALTRRMFTTEGWFRGWAAERVNLAGPVPTEYNIALETARLIVANHHTPEATT